GRMTVLTKSAKHMLDSVRSVKEAEEHPTIKALKLVEHHALTLSQHTFALIEKRKFIQPAVVEACVIFRHSRGMKDADLLRKLARVTVWRTDREERRLGIKVDW